MAEKLREMLVEVGIEDPALVEALVAEWLRAHAEEAGGSYRICWQTLARDLEEGER